MSLESCLESHQESDLEVLFKEIAEELGIPLVDDSESDKYSIWGHKDGNIIISYSKRKCPEEEYDFELAFFSKEGVSDVSISGQLWDDGIVEYIIQFKVAARHYEEELNKIQYDEKLRDPELHLSGLMRYMLLDRGPPTEGDINFDGTCYLVVRTHICELKGVKTLVCNQFKGNLTRK